MGPHLGGLQENQAAHSGQCWCYAADHPPAGGCEPHHTGSVAQQDSERQDSAILMQGLQLPSRLSVAADPLPANVRPPSAPPQPGPAHQYHLPSSTVGQARLEEEETSLPQWFCHLQLRIRNSSLLHPQVLNW